MSPGSGQRLVLAVGQLRERMADEHSFPTVVAAQILDEEDHFTPGFEDFIESASSVLVLDRLLLDDTFADPVIVAAWWPPSSTGRQTTTSPWSCPARTPTKIRVPSCSPRPVCC
ncbi:hypothetical protein LUX34_01630 [Streptomyces werraensis]|nr:hypothetical protein [Streptomyces werraensis]